MNDMWVSKWWQNLDLPVNYALFKAKDATKVCFHTNKLIVCKRDMLLNCAPGLVLHDMRQLTLSSDFYFKAIQNKKTGRAREKQKDGKDTRQTCPVTHKYLPHALRTDMSLGPAEVARQTRRLALLFLKPLNLTTLQKKDRLRSYPKHLLLKTDRAEKSKDMLSE